MSTEKNINILTLYEEKNDAEELVNTLRKNSLLARYQNADSPQALADLAKVAGGALIVTPESEPDQTQRLVDVLKKENVSFELDVLASEFSVEKQQQYIGMGVSDFVDDDYEALVCKTIAKAHVHLKNTLDAVSVRSKYQQSEERANQLMNSSRDAIAYIHEGMHIVCNESYVKLFGFRTKDEVLCAPFLTLVEGDHQGEMKKFLKQVEAGAESRSVEFKAVQENGDAFDASLEVAPASLDGEECVQLLIRNSEVLDEQIGEVRSRDIVTNLYNSRHLNEVLDKTLSELTEAKPSAGYLFYIDLDNFKPMSDELGLVATDSLLFEIARFLEKETSDKAVLARYTGDVYLAIDPGLTEEQANAQGAQICEKIKQESFVINKIPVKCTCSVGVTEISNSSNNSAHLISKAEQACKQAKTAQRGTHYLYSEGDEKEKNEKDQQALTQLKELLSGNHVSLMYQPIINLKGESSAKFKAVLGPSETFPADVDFNELFEVAKQNQNTTLLESWTLVRIAKLLADDSFRQQRVRLFMPLSRDTIIRKEFIEIFKHRFSKTPETNRHVALEIDIRDLLGGDQRFKHFVAYARSLGFAIVVRKVANIGDLKTLLETEKVHYVKIDGALINVIGNSEESAQAVKNIHQIAEQHKIKTIAEDVVEVSAIAALYHTGVDFIEGEQMHPPQDDFSESHVEEM